MRQQYAFIVKTTNRILGYINRRVFCGPRKVIFLFGTVEVFLEYCVQFSVPHFKKDMDRLERVWWRVTNIIKGLGNKT